MTGTGMEALGLQAILRAVQALFGEAIKDRLGPKASSEKARERAFYLYELLGTASDLTDRFVSELRLYVNSVIVTKDVPPRGQHKRQHKLVNPVRPEYTRLADTLIKLEQALYQVNPQLEVHQPKLVNSIHHFGTSRAGVIKELQEVTPEEHDRLRRTLNDAEVNQALIKEVITEMRMFLAETFPFRESF